MIDRRTEGSPIPSPTPRAIRLAKLSPSVSVESFLSMEESVPAGTVVVTVVGCPLLLVVWMVVVETRSLRKSRKT
jgi:hypothetical protein